MTSDIGLIETFLCAGRRAPFWGAHWKRLKMSAGKIGIPLKPHVNPQVISVIRQLGPHPHRVRLLLAPDGTADISIRGYDAPWLESAAPLSEKLICVAAPRDYPGAWAGLKTTARAGLEKAFKSAKSRGASDAILRRPDILYETTRGNLFWIRDGAVYTPSLALGCLPGVLRAWVIRRLRRWNIPVREGRYRLPALKAADAVMRTNALIGVSHVEEIAGIKKWPSPVHPLVLRLHAELKKLFGKQD